MIAAAPIGRRTATILARKIAMPKVAATNADVLNTSAAKFQVIPPVQIDASKPRFEFLTIPKNCSIENQTKPKHAIQIAIINADNASFLIILKKSLGVNSCRARPRIIRAIVCPPAFPPVSIRTGINAAKIGTRVKLFSNLERTIDENVPKTRRTTIHGTHFLTMEKVDVSK